MEQVGIKALKNRLSSYVRAAASGHTVLVTDRGRVVAELIAPRVQEGGSDDDRRLGELIRLGLMRPARAGPKARLPVRQPTTTLEEVLRRLDEGRSER
jgi:antitoxin (DNA-binding transcriptional repressor) of toxin-antitoxin stability system